MLIRILNVFNDAEFTYFSVIAILSISLIISSLEELFSFSTYNENGLLSWKISMHH